MRWIQLSASSSSRSTELEPVLTLVQRIWWVRAVICLNPEMLDGVASDISRVAAGDESVFADEGRMQAK
jgi:hypothetical protein